MLTYTSQTLRRRALRDNLKLNDLLAVGRALELSEVCASAMESSNHTVNATTHENAQISKSPAWQSAAVSTSKQQHLSASVAIKSPTQTRFF